MLPYFRDLRDNLARLEETAASYHERLLMAFDIYLNKAAFEANEGIKFLTALTAVTIPVMVVGTWYGMNFEHMPEVDSKHGYLYAVGITLTCHVADVPLPEKEKVVLNHLVCAFGLHSETNCLESKNFNRNGRCDALVIGGDRS